MALDMDKQPFSESQKLKFAKTFFWGKSLEDDLVKIHTKQCIFMVVWKRRVVISGLTQFLFHIGMDILLPLWAWTLA